MLAAGTMVASVIAGCSRNPEDRPVTPRQAGAAAVQVADGESDPRNVYNVLAGYEFVGQDGQPVNIDALKSSLRGNFATLTFGFGDCQQYCPMINRVLATLAGSTPR